MLNSCRCLIDILKGEAMAENQKAPRPSLPDKENREPVKEESGLMKDLKGIGSYIYKDVIKPLGKKIIYDSIMTALNVKLYPDGDGPDRRLSSGPTSHTSYDKKWDESRNRGRSIAQNGYEAVRFSYRQDAQYVLGCMRADIIDDRYVSLLQYYEYANEVLDPNEKVVTRHTDSNYGWTNLQSAYIKPTSDNRFILVLPKPMPIE